MTEGVSKFDFTWEKMVNFVKWVDSLEHSEVKTKLAGLFLDVFRDHIKPKAAVVDVPAYVISYLGVNNAPEEVKGRFRRYFELFMELA